MSSMPKERLTDLRKILGVAIRARLSLLAFVAAMLVASLAAELIKCRALAQEAEKPEED